MAGWNGSGVFTLPYNWEADASAGIDILASRMDAQFAEISAQGFGNTITRDGQGQPTAALPMAGFKHTGAAVASGSGEYIVYQQVVGGSLAATFASVTTASLIGTGGALTITGTIGITGPLTVTGAATVVGTMAITGAATAANGTTGSQIVNISQFPATTGTTGTMTLPNGVIMKWGSGTTTSGTGSVSFGAAFPNACDGVQITIAGGTTTASVHPLLLGAKTAAGFAVWGDAGESLGFNWLAVGH